MVDISLKGSPERPPFSFLFLLIKLFLLVLVVFVRINAAILLFNAIVVISEMSLSSMSGETFNNKGILLFFVFFISLSEIKRSSSFFCS